MKAYTALCCVLLLALASFVSSCAFKEGSTQLANTAFLTFSGSANGLTLQVDENTPIPMQNGENDTLYEIAPGKRHVRVWQSSQVVVNRDIFVSRGQTFEIALP